VPVICVNFIDRNLARLIRRSVKIHVSYDSIHLHVDLSSQRFVTLDGTTGESSPDPFRRGVLHVPGGRWSIQGVANLKNLPRHPCETLSLLLRLRWKYGRHLYRAREPEAAVISGHEAGGQLSLTTLVENFPGFRKESMTGPGGEHQAAGHPLRRGVHARRRDRLPISRSARSASMWKASGSRR